MKKNLLIAAMGLLTMASCTNDEDVNNLIAKNDNAISFDTYVGKTTKAATDNTELQNTGFNVIATYTGDGVENTWEKKGTTTNPNFMYNQPVTYNATNWTYTPMKYWPNNTDAQITFFAYAPTGATGVTLSEATKTGAPTITFTVQDAIDSQVDLVADMLVDQKKTESAISFEFNHLLSQINFQAKLAAQYTDATVTVTGIKVDFLADKIKKNGVYTFTDNNAAAGIWAVPTTQTYHSGSITSPTLSSVLNNTATPTATPLLSSMFLIPQTYAKGDITATITYTVASGSGTNVSSVENTITTDLPIIADGWLPNKKYAYTIEISLTGVSITATASDWGSGVPVP